MLKSLFEYIPKIKFKKKLVQFYCEVAQNWENWHVMHQRNVLGKFRLDVCSSVGDDPRLSSVVSLPEYVRKLTEYNQSMDEYQSYEQWYSSDIKNKVTENARILHAKKEAAAAIFKDVLGVIEPLKSALENQLRLEGIIKH